MSILIKNMKMPTSCYDCNCFIRDSGGIDYCCLLMQDIEDSDKCDDDCPLVSVSPHGRLIDEESICGQLRPLIENPYCYNRLQIISETLAHCLQIISDVPTIIPAEEEKS